MKLSQQIEHSINVFIEELPTPLANLYKGKLGKPLKSALHRVFDKLGNPVAWQAPQHQPLRGVYKKNKKLKKLQPFLRFGTAMGPESIAIAENGMFYTGLHDGRIMQFNQDGSQVKEVANTGGRPLGMRMHPDGDLLVCDTKLGLLKVAVSGEHKGKHQVLTNQAEGIPFGFTDDLDISKDGKTIYFTDASSRWGYEQDTFDHIEHGGHGRFMRYDMDTKTTTVLMRNLCFCNGVALSANEDYVLVTETGSYCVHRYWLKNSGSTKAGTHDIFIDNLPGFPDNIRFNGNDKYWIAIPVIRNRMLDAVAPHPIIRFAVMQFLKVKHIPIKQSSMVIAVNTQGKVTDNLQYHGKHNYHFVTQAIEHNNTLYCSSLYEDGVSKLPLS